MSAVAEQSSAARLMEGFESRLTSLYGDAALRRDAAQYFISKGIPDRKWEDYKYIHPAGLFKKDFSVASEEARAITSHDIAEMVLAPGAAIVVVLNGVFVPELSKTDRLPQGVTVKSIADAVVSDSRAAAHYSRMAGAMTDPFIAWNTAMNSGGVYIHIDKNVQSEIPVHVIHIASNVAASVVHPRNLYVSERDSRCEIIESFETIGPVKTFTNVVTEVVVNENAQLDHYRMQLEGEAGYQMNTVAAKTYKGSNYKTYTFSLSGAWVRNNLNIVFTESNAEAHLYGLTLLNGNRMVDHHTIVDHAVPHCMSNELYKGVLDGKSVGVFNGKIFVRKDAQKTNAYQTNRNILMSDDAVINTKPQLEIYADDVKCSHGTSTGRLDEDALFYLRARGIGETSARKLLVRAFAEEVVNTVPNDAIKAYLDNRLDHIMI
ncbi:MAG: Fe-S cluster assembly protein SufD [Bacteroidia bacterium]